MTRVVVAPDSFKGSIRAAAAARALRDGWLSVRRSDEVVLRPMADGGEGTLDAFAAAVAGAGRMPVRVAPPAGESRGSCLETDWLLLPATPDAPGGTGVVELASTSGIELYGDRREPWRSSTTGFGDAIAAALDAGVSRLVLAIGSSASTDGGAGLLHALGARLRTASGHDARLRIDAEQLARLTSADLTAIRHVPEGGAIVLTDVTAPLCGPAGAAFVFGPQKGVPLDRLGELDATLANYAELFDVDPATPGAGAAGGAGFGLLVWGATLVPGAQEIARLIGLDDAVTGADLVVTGEGAFDESSLAGKAPALVLALAAEAGVPAAMVAGRIDPNVLPTGLAAAISLDALAGSARAALAEPAHWLRIAGAELATRFARRARHAA